VSICVGCVPSFFPEFSIKHHLTPFNFSEVHCTGLDEVTRSSGVCVFSVQRLEVADDGVDVDIEGGDDKKEVDKKSVSCSVEEVEVEEFFVKYRNL